MAENKTTMTTGPFTLGWRDLLMAFIRAVIGSVLTQVYSVVDAMQSGQHFTFNWKLTVIVALGAGLSDIIKRFVDPAKLIISKPTQETVKEVQNITAK